MRTLLTRADVSSSNQVFPWGSNASDTDRLLLRVWKGNLSPSEKPAFESFAQVDFSARDLRVTVINHHEVFHIIPTQRTNFTTWVLITLPDWFPPFLSYTLTFWTLCMLSWPAGRVCDKLLVFIVHNLSLFALALLAFVFMCVGSCNVFFPDLNGLWFKNIQTLANCDTVNALHFVSAFQKLRVNKTNEITSFSFCHKTFIPAVLYKQRRQFNIFKDNFISLCTTLTFRISSGFPQRIVQQFESLVATYKKTR